MAKNLPTTRHQIKQIDIMKWVKASERLPESGVYFCRSENGGMYADRYTIDKGWSRETWEYDNEISPTAFWLDETPDNVQDSEQGEKIEFSDYTVKEKTTALRLAAIDIIKLRKELKSKEQEIQRLKDELDGLKRRMEGPPEIQR